MVVSSREVARLEKQRQPQSKAGFVSKALSDPIVRAVFDEMHQLMAILDPEGTVLAVNRTALDRADVRLADVRGTPFWETPWWRHSEEARQTLRSAVEHAATGAPYTAHTTNAAGDGSTFVVEFSLRPVYTDGSEPTYLLAEGRDVTELVRKAEEIDEAERLFRFVLGEGPAIHLVLTRDGLVSYASGTFEEMVGSEIRGGEKPELASLVREDQRDAVRERIELLFEGTECEPMPVAVLSRDGGEHTLIWSGQGFTSETAQGVHVVITAAIDVTELQRQREREEALQREIERSARLASIGTLASGIAHEINNPNNYMRLNAENLRDICDEARDMITATLPADATIQGIPVAELYDTVRRMIVAIMDGSTRIATLTRELRDYSRPDEHETPQTVAVRDVVEAAHRIIASKVKKSTGNFGIEVAADVPRITVRRHKIEQVIINLVNNACEALTDRSQAVRVEARATPEGDAVVIRVADEGQGITTADLERVRDPFFTSRRATGGTGMGLSITERIVHDHGGTMEIDSRVDEGTTVTVRIPVAPPQVDSAAAGGETTP